MRALLHAAQLPVGRRAALGPSRRDTTVRVPMGCSTMHRSALLPRCQWEGPFPVAALAGRYTYAFRAASAAAPRSASTGSSPTASRAGRSDPPGPVRVRKASKSWSSLSTARPWCKTRTPRVVRWRRTAPRRTVTTPRLVGDGGAPRALPGAGVRRYEAATPPCRWILAVPARRIESESERPFGSRLPAVISRPAALARRL